LPCNFPLNYKNALPYIALAKPALQLPLSKILLLTAVQDAVDRGIEPGGVCAEVQVRKRDLRNSAGQRQEVWQHGSVGLPDY